MENNKNKDKLGYGDDWNADEARHGGPGSSDDTKNAWNDGKMVGDDQSASPADSNQTKENWDRGLFADGEKPEIGADEESTETGDDDSSGNEGSSKNPQTREIAEKKLKEKAEKAAAGKAEKGAATKVVGFFAGSGKFKLIAALLFVIIGTILLVLFAFLYTDDACATPTSGLISEDQLTKASSTFPGSKNKDGETVTHSDYLMPTDSGGNYDFRQSNIVGTNGQKNYQNQYGRLETIQGTYSIAKKWNSLPESDNNKLLIGDINAYVETHESHATGVDVDIFSAGDIFMDSENQKEGKYENRRPDNTGYNKDMAIELGKIALETKAIEKIYYNDADVIKAVNDYASAQGLPGKMEGYEDHENHFHLRFKAGATPIDVALGVSGDISDPDSACTGTGGATRPTIICVDPGHPSDPKNGGKNPNSGATGELDFNWEMANLLEPALEAKGYTVVRTRDAKDTVQYQAERIKKCVEAKGDFWFALHAESDHDDKPYLIYPDASHPKTSAPSKELADKIHEKLHPKYTKGKAPCTAPIGCSTAGLAFAEAEKTGLRSLFIEISLLSGGQPSDPDLKSEANKKEFINTLAEGIMNAIPPTQSGGGSIVEVANNFTDDVDTLRDSNTDPDYPDSGKSEIIITDCGRFVSNVMRASGSDPNFPVVGSSTIYNYLLDHPEKYLEVDASNTANLQAGDIIVKPGHVMMYAGTSGVNGKSRWQASLWGEVPHNLKDYSFYNSAFKGFRLK